MLNTFKSKRQTVWFSQVWTLQPLFQLSSSFNRHTFCFRHTLWLKWMAVIALSIKFYCSVRSPQAERGTWGGCSVIFSVWAWRIKINLTSCSFYQSNSLNTFIHCLWPPTHQTLRAHESFGDGRCRPCWMNHCRFSTTQQLNIGKQSSACSDWVCSLFQSGKNVRVQKYRSANISEANFYTWIFFTFPSALSWMYIGHCFAVPPFHWVCEELWAA